MKHKNAIICSIIMLIFCILLEIVIGFLCTGCTANEYARNQRNNNKSFKMEE